LDITYIDDDDNDTDCDYDNNGGVGSGDDDYNDDNNGGTEDGVFRRKEMLIRYLGDRSNSAERTPS
jgi:hypothetical protein